MRARAIIKGIYDWFWSLPPLICILVICIMGAVFVRGLMSWGALLGLEEQPVSEELQTVIAVGYGIDFKQGRYFVRLRDAQGNERRMNISENDALRCKVGQPIVVLNQGVDQRLHASGCDKKTLSGT